ncbi:small ribosomal subunit protein uS17m-like [Amphiura filiformis]|uniref:small ribosomal subunit protein uS17m-like n=1 Tax=Amphiura filiformis TaxID=82378 RepID=UPI003B22035A
MSGGRVGHFLLAKVMSTSLSKVAKCEVNRLKLDKYVMKYYGRRRTVLARDEERLAKEGDVVLLKEMPEKVSKRVSHKVDRVIYSLGNVTDPITGLKCDKDGYWESRRGEWDENMMAKAAERTEEQYEAQEGTAV